MAELFLFIMVSMTYLNAMEDRGVFDSLRVWLLSKNFSLSAIILDYRLSVVLYFVRLQQSDHRLADGFGYFGYG